MDTGLVGARYTKSHSIEASIFVSLSGDLAAGSHFSRDTFTGMPNTEGGQRFHPDYPFLVESGWVGLFTGGITIQRSWEEDEGVTEDWFTTQASITNEFLEGHGNVTYSDIDMVARTCTSRQIITPTKTYWSEHPFMWDINTGGLRVEFDEGANFLCCIIIAEDWERWTTKVRDVLANTVEIIDRPAADVDAYISFNQDILINGKPYEAGTTIKMANPSFEITTTLATTLVAHY